MRVSLSVIHERLPLEVHRAVFAWVLKLAHEKKLLEGKTLGVDSTTLEANAAIKSIVRRDTEENWQEHLTNLMQAEGVLDADETPTIDENKKFDKTRKNKKVSNDEWKNPTDADSRIAKMKDRTTHLAYKAGHAVDLQTEKSCLMRSLFGMGTPRGLQKFENLLDDPLCALQLAQNVVLRLLASGWSGPDIA